MSKRKTVQPEEKSSMQTDMDTPENIQMYLTVCFPSNGISCSEQCMQKDYAMNEFGRLIQCVFFCHGVNVYMQMSREEQKEFK